MRQRLGQHFLRDPKVLRTILAAAELQSHPTALEIGPGRGALTIELAPLVRRLVAVELDRSLADSLSKRLPSVDLLQEDILRVDLDPLFSAAERPIRILGNLPYAITSPIFEKLLAWPGWDIGVFLVQKEVAERIQSPAGARAFGMLTLAVDLFAQAEHIMTVKPGAFLPPPRVHSAVIRLRRRATPLVTEAAQPSFFDLARGAFAHRRKTAANSLALHTGIDRPHIENWLCAQGIDGGARAETLLTTDYARLAEPWSIFRREHHLTAPEPRSRIPRVSKKDPSTNFPDTE